MKKNFLLMAVIVIALCLSACNAVTSQPPAASSSSSQTPSSSTVSASAYTDAAGNCVVHDWIKHDVADIYICGVCCLIQTGQTDSSFYHNYDPEELLNHQNVPVHCLRCGIVDELTCMVSIPDTCTESGVCVRCRTIVAPALGHASEGFASITLADGTYASEWRVNPPDANGNAICVRCGAEFNVADPFNPPVYHKWENPLWVFSFDPDDQIATVEELLNGTA